MTDKPTPPVLDELAKLRGSIQYERSHSIIGGDQTVCAPLERAHSIIGGDRTGGDRDSACSSIDSARTSTDSKAKD